MALPACHTAAMMPRGWVNPQPCSLEPYEAGWARDAVAYVCVHETAASTIGLRVVLESSADGLRWAPLHAMDRIEEPGVYRMSVTGFGNWLRATLSAEPTCCVDFYWVMK